MGEHDNKADAAFLLMSEIRVEMGRLSIQVSNLNQKVDSLSNHAERLVKLETRLEQAEKQASTYRQVMGFMISAIAAVLSIAATHVVWK